MHLIFLECIGFCVSDTRINELKNVEEKGRNFWFLHLLFLPGALLPVNPVCLEEKKKAENMVVRGLRDFYQVCRLLHKMPSVLHQVKCFHPGRRDSADFTEPAIKAGTPVVLPLG